LAMAFENLSIARRVGHVGCNLPFARLGAESGLLGFGMQFRWVAFITLWTMFIGPILAGPARFVQSDAKSSTHGARKNGSTAHRPHSLH
jgi:hypothetical protein